MDVNSRNPHNADWNAGNDVQIPNNQNVDLSLPQIQEKNQLNLTKVIPSNPIGQNEIVPITHKVSLSPPSIAEDVQQMIINLSKDEKNPLNNHMNRLEQSIAQQEELANEDFNVEEDPFDLDDSVEELSLTLMEKNTTIEEKQQFSEMAKSGNLEKQTGHLEEQTGHLEEQIGHLEEQIGHSEEQIGHSEEHTGHLEEEKGLQISDESHQENTLGQDLNEEATEKAEVSAEKAVQKDERIHNAAEADKGARDYLNKIASNAARMNILGHADAFATFDHAKLLTMKNRSEIESYIDKHIQANLHKLYEVDAAGNRVPLSDEKLKQFVKEIKEITIAYCQNFGSLPKTQTTKKEERAQHTEHRTRSQTHVTTPKTFHITVGANRKDKSKVMFMASIIQAENKRASTQEKRLEKERSLEILDTKRRIVNEDVKSTDLKHTIIKAGTLYTSIMKRANPQNPLRVILRSAHAA